MGPIGVTNSKISKQQQQKKQQGRQMGDQGAEEDLRRSSELHSCPRVPTGNQSRTRKGHLTRHIWSFGDSHQNGTCLSTLIFSFPWLTTVVGDHEEEGRKCRQTWDSPNSSSLMIDSTVLKDPYAPHVSPRLNTIYFQKHCCFRDH